MPDVTVGWYTLSDGSVAACVRRNNNPWERLSVIVDGLGRVSGARVRVDNSKHVFTPFNGQSDNNLDMFAGKPHLTMIITALMGCS